MAIGAIFVKVMGPVILALSSAAPGEGQRGDPPPTAERDGTSDALPVTVQVVNDMGRNFRLVEVRLMLDGVEVARKEASAGEELERSFRAFHGVVVGPGPHALNTVLVYEGRNRGPITYLDNYRFRVTRDFTFGNGDAEPSAVIEVVARERQGIDIPVEERPTLVIQLSPGPRSTPPVTNPKPASALPVSTPPPIPPPR